MKNSKATLENLEEKKSILCQSQFLTGLAITMSKNLEGILLNGIKKD